MTHDHGRTGQQLLGGVVGVLWHANLSGELVGDAPVNAMNIAYQFATQVCTFGRCSTMYMLSQFVQKLANDMCDQEEHGPEREGQETGGLL